MGRYFRLLLIIIACAYFWYYVSTYTEWHFIDNVDLIFHEAGHTIFSFFNLFTQILAGSVFQVALPLFISIYFFFSEQKISGALCLLWVGQNLLNVSIYAGDALRMQINLLGGDGVIHDWNYLLSTVGLLNSTSTVALIIYAMGLITMFLGTILSLDYWWQSTSQEPRRVL